MVHGANVLPQKEIEEAFKHQFGCTLNFPQFSGALKKLNKWYEDRGIFGQVTTYMPGQTLHIAWVYHLCSQAQCAGQLYLMSVRGWQAHICAV